MTTCLTRIVRNHCRVEPGGCWIWLGHAQDGRLPVLGIGGRKLHVRPALLAGTPKQHPSDRAGTRCGQTLCCNPKHLLWVSRHPGAGPVMRARWAAAMAKRPGYLSLEAARRIRSEGPATPKEQEACAARYGVSRRTIFNIVTHRVWKDPMLGGLA